MSDEKPREFWIIKEPPYSTWVSDKPLHSADTHEEIHVITKSTYDALALENEKLLADLDLAAEFIRSILPAWLPDCWQDERLAMIKKLGGDK